VAGLARERRTSLVIFAGLVLSLLLAWLNFLLTGRWAALPGALNGARWPFYGAALLAATVLAIVYRREVGRPVRIGRLVPLLLLAAGAATLVAAVFSRMPVSVWSQIPFEDDWTELFQQAAIGVRAMHRGSVGVWNWWLQGGYPSSTDIAQNFSALALIPMTVFGNAVGYHVLHVFVFLALPVLVWLDVREDDADAAIVAAGFACFFVAGYFAGLGKSGDTNSLMGVFSAAIALAGSRRARRGRRWGGPILLLGLTLALYSHPAFFVCALMLLALEALYFRDRGAAIRLVVAALAAGVASLPMHWESFRYPAYVSFNNTVYDPSAPKDWALALRTVYYNVEILALPQRWFNDYRSIANVWLPALLVAAVRTDRSRAGFYVWATLLIQLSLRVNTSEAGAIFDRMQHMLPILAAPALAGFIVRCAGTRTLASALMAAIGLYVATSFAPIRHVPDLRAWDPPLIDRIAAADGNMILVEINPHRDMDADPVRRTPPTPFGVHYEGLLPELAHQRFYSQMIDGWAFNVWRGEVVGGGTWRGRIIDEAPVETFASEMRQWGVRHLFVWTDRSRDYLARSGRFVERWRGGLWSQFEMLEPDTRSVVTTSGEGTLRNLDYLSGEVSLRDVRAGDTVIVRAHYYPAWRAFARDREVALYPEAGQLAFRAPESGTYVVQLRYPRYAILSIAAAAVFLLGAWVLSRSLERFSVVGATTM
jgi:hypothetical protein